MKTILCALWLLFAEVGLAQQPQPKPEMKSFEELDRFLAGCSKQDDSAACLPKLEKYWEKQNDAESKLDAEAKLKYNRVVAENERLKKELDNSVSYGDLRLWAIVAFAWGIGAALAVLAVRGLVRWFRRFRPLTPMRKKFIAALIAAVWLALAAWGSATETEHPIGALVEFMLLSVPAVVFTWVVFWWQNAKAGVSAT